MWAGVVGWLFGPKGEGGEVLIDSLPTEIWEEILVLIPPKQLLNCVIRVNSQFSRLIDSNVLWHRLWKTSFSSAPVTLPQGYTWLDAWRLRAQAEIRTTPTRIDHSSWAKGSEEFTQMLSCSNKYCEIRTYSLEMNLAVPSDPDLKELVLFASMQGFTLRIPSLDRHGRYGFTRPEHVTKIEADNTSSLLERMAATLKSELDLDNQEDSVVRSLEGLLGVLLKDAEWRDKGLIICITDNPFKVAEASVHFLICPIDPSPHSKIRLISLLFERKAICFACGMG